MSQNDNLDDLVSRFLNHDRTALARIITLVESNFEIAHQILSRLREHSNNAYILGVTGSPGTGKSTLITHLAEYLSSKGYKIGIISVDPSSPIGGGAFLGDRVRMRDIILNSNVFIRSVASRGSMGGISKSVYDITNLYDAYGMDYIFIETVGAGQSEVDIFQLAYTVVLITIPGTGDSVQVQKAGILEIADIFVINKSDLGGDFLKININMMLESASPKSDWRIPIVRTVATEGRGIADLFQAVQQHRNYLETSGKLNEKKRRTIRTKLKALIKSQLYTHVLEEFSPSDVMEKLVGDVFNGTKDIYTAVFEILEPLFNRLSKIQ